MKEFELKGEVRSELGKKATKSLRVQGLVPCNLYGEKKDKDGKPVSTPFMVKKEDVRKLVYSPDIFSVNLTLGKDTCKAVMRELQFHPVSDMLLHIDFYQITDEKPIVMEVPIKLNGLAEGVRAGGKLTASVRSLKVKAVYSQIPERLDIDVTHLNLGKTIKVGELSFEGLELITSKEVVVCGVKMTRNAVSAAAADAAAATATPDAAAPAAESK